MEITKFQRSAAVGAVVALFALVACDARDDDAEHDDAAQDEDLEERGWGCAYSASSPHAVDGTYFPDGGKSKGGCDLHVTAHALAAPESGVTVSIFAYSDAPVSDYTARVWARQCNALYCDPWTIDTFDWQDLDFGVGYCDAEETIPCKYRVSAYAVLPHNKSFNRFRVGTRVIDENGTPVYVTVREIE